MCITGIGFCAEGTTYKKKPDPLYIFADTGFAGGGVHLNISPQKDFLGRCNFFFYVWGYPFHDWYKVETSFMSITFLYNSDNERYLSCNPLFPFAWTGMGMWFGFGPASHGGWGNLSLLALAPQMLGNLKIHVPLYFNRLTAYAGQNTDYFPFGEKKFIITATNIGVRLQAGTLSIGAEMSKPWFVHDIIDSRVRASFLVGLNDKRHLHFRDHGR
jgi:hypothetical protein